MEWKCVLSYELNKNNSSLENAKRMGSMQEKMKNYYQQVSRFELSSNI